MAKRVYDVCVGEEGKDKKVYWKKIGVVFQGDKGLSIKLEMVPVGWSGWATFFEPREKDSKQADTKKAREAEDSDIPY